MQPSLSKPSEETKKPSHQPDSKHLDSNQTQQPSDAKKRETLNAIPAKLDKQQEIAHSVSRKPEIPPETTATTEETKTVAESSKSES